MCTASEHPTYSPDMSDVFLFLQLKCSERTIICNSQGRHCKSYNNTKGIKELFLGILPTALRMLENVSLKQ
jgi:hypothetical protein